MAAAHGHLADGSDDTFGEDTPLPFQQAVAALREARPRPEVEIAAIPGPRRPAPFSYALEAAVVQEGEELADGRLILLYDPAGQDTWQGAFRLVTLVRAELEPEIAADPLLPEVCWSWLTGAFEAQGVPYDAASGTVTRAGSYYFGGLAEREPTMQIEIRASWTPREGANGVPDTAAHLAAWCELLCQIAGLPPGNGGDGGVVSLPQRRGPQPR